MGVKVFLSLLDVVERLSDFGCRVGCKDEESEEKFGELVFWVFIYC